MNGRLLKGWKVASMYCPKVEGVGLTIVVSYWNDHGIEMTTQAGERYELALTAWIGGKNGLSP